METGLEVEVNGPHQAVAALARVLYESMERLDPGIDQHIGWGELTDRQREFYELCVSDVLERRDLITRAI